VFGLDAQRVQHDADWDVCRSFKRFLEDEDPNSALSIGSLQLPVLEWLTRFFSALHEDLLHRSNLEVSAKETFQVIVGVPANAKNNQRFLTLEAFRNAGFEVLGMLNEPAAAGIEYANRYRRSDLSKRREHVAVYDLGGGTFDVSVIRMSSDLHDVVTSEGISRLGGDDFDEILLNLALSQPSVAEATAKWIARSRLLNLCREAKESINPNTRKIIVDLGQVSLIGGEVMVPVSQFYEKCQPLIDRTVQATEAALQQVLGAEPQSLDCVYLVGGSCELPVLARALKERFGKRVRRSPYPSAATAIGLAITAGQKATYQLKERFHRHFGVWRESESGTRIVFDPIFAKGTPLPENGEQPLTVTRRYQPAHNVGHYRFIECSQLGEAGEPKGDIVAWDQILFPLDPKTVTQTDLTNLPVIRWSDGQGQEIEEVYYCDSRGIIEISISNRSEGVTKSYRIRKGNQRKVAKQR
jgi:molecular chaperone DnaK (HSP70)